MMTLRTEAETSKLISRLAPLTEESIVDERDFFSPAEHVQHKLSRMLPSNLMPVSSMHTARPVRRFATKA